jgi:TIR domain
MTDAPQTELPVIFINYRRMDAGWSAHHLGGRLKDSFGPTRVFLDVRDLDAGDDFGAVIEDHLRRATVLLVLIANGWLGAHDKFLRRRLDSDKDWVRREIRFALENEGCTVIPVLIDDAELPDDREALPEDIAALLTRQHIQVRQAHSDDDTEALCRELEKAGFSRLDTDRAQLLGNRVFSDKEVHDVVTHLRTLQARVGGKPLAARELLHELDFLFNRKTFRFEALRRCTEQRWADRLDSSYQTLTVLEACTRIIKEVAEDKYPTYRDLVREVDVYCMQMGALLFDPPVDYNSIEEHIGKATFKAQLPKAIRFPVGPDQMPKIPDPINDGIEPHRLRAVALMDTLEGR